MDRKIYAVEVTLAGMTRPYSSEFQTADQYKDGWKRVLLMAHGKADVRCTCPGSGERRLSIHSRSNSDRFHLARFPETGSEHSEDCVYYGVDPPKSSGGSMRAQVVDIALMQITRDWIPVDSGYEALVADKLVAEKRRFEKPLRFDAGEDAAFPDFWLRDRHTPAPLEVWGMSTPEYLARKAEKGVHYDETYGKEGWWSWNASIGDPVPDFPAPLRSHD